MKYPDLCPHCLALGLQNTGGVTGTSTYSVRLKCRGPDKHTFHIKRPGRTKEYGVRVYETAPIVKNPVPRREAMPFRELHRNPFALMELAMMTRKR